MVSTESLLAWFRARLVSFKMELWEAWREHQAEKRRLKEWKATKRLSDQRIAQAVTRILPHITRQQWEDGQLSEPAGLFGGHRRRVVALAVYRPQGTWLQPYSGYLVWVSKEGYVYASAYPRVMHEPISGLNPFTSNRERNEVAALLEEYADTLALIP